VVGVILRGAMIPLAAGLAAGIAAAFPLSRLVAAELYGFHGSDPIPYAGSAILVLFTGTVASIRPAWRAAAADPLPALRME